ncbi:putative nuclease of putative toxin-antitoxin system [Oxalobacteraceae bacterium GrIS 2.11]
MERLDDRAIWQFAKVNDYVIVTKDDDFQGLSGMNGYPPKVIRLVTGNSANQEVINALLQNSNEIVATLLNPTVGYIEIC